MDVPWASSQVELGSSVSRCVGCLVPFGSWTRFPYVVCCGHLVCVSCVRYNIVRDNESYCTTCGLIFDASPALRMLNHMEQDERCNHEPTTAFQTAQDHAQALMYELSLINESSSVVYMRHVLSSAERFLDAHQEFPFIDLRLKLCTLESMLRSRELLLYRQKHFIDRVTEDWQREFETQAQGRMEGQSSPTSTAPLETPTAEERYPAPPSHAEDTEKGREMADIVPPPNSAPFSAPSVNASVASTRVIAPTQNLSYTNAQASAPPIPPPPPPPPPSHPTFTPHPSPPPSPNAHQIQIQLTNSNNNTNGPLSLSFRFRPTEDREAITFDRPQTLVDTPPANDQSVQTRARAGRSQPPPPLRLETTPIILPNSPVPFKVLPLPEVSESERETRDTPTTIAFKRPQVRAKTGSGSRMPRSMLGVEIKHEVALGFQLQLEAGPEIVEGDEDTVLFGAERRSRPHSHTPTTTNENAHDPRAASEPKHSAFLLSPNEPGSLDRHHFIESRERGTWSAPESVCLSGMAEEEEEAEKQRQREEIECIKARIYQPRPGYVIPWGVFWRGMEKWEEKQNVVAAGHEQEQQQQCQDHCDRDQQERHQQQADGNIAEVDETMHVDSMGTGPRQISSRPFFNNGTSFVPEPVIPQRTSSARLQMFDFSLIATPPGYESDCEAFGGFSPAMRSRRGRGRRVEFGGQLLHPHTAPPSTETSLNAGFSFPISPRSSESVSPVSPLPRTPYAAHARSLPLGLESGLLVGVNDSEEEEEEEEETNREGNLGNGIKRHLLHTISEEEEEVEEEEENAASDSGAEADREEDDMDTDQDTAAFLGDSFYTSGGEVHDRSWNHDEDPEVGGFLGDSFYTSGGGDEDPDHRLVDEQQERGPSSQSGISDESVASLKADDSTRSAVTRTTTNGSSPSLNKTDHFKGRPLPPIPVGYSSSFSEAKP